MKKAIVLAGSRGIGRAIATELKQISYEVVATSKEELDTSDMSQIRKFAEKHPQTDILCLNTGGPPAKPFEEITPEDLEKYHTQLFSGLFYLLQKITVRDGGYIFLISSYTIKEPDENLILSNSYRIALSSVLKSISKTLAQREVSCINIAPGPIKTDRLHSLVKDMDQFEKTLPMKRAGAPEEIGRFVRAIVENNIKYLTGVTINFDGGNSHYVL